MSQLKILDITDTCTGCGACVNVCPKHCLRLEPDLEGFYVPKYQEGCIECGLCEKTCHVIHSTGKKPISKDSVFIYHSSDNGIREKSSSGGAFSLFADYVIQSGGVVFATLYNPETKRVEVSNTDLFPLQKFRKSKYVESFFGDSYSPIRTELKKGRKILFCGTPCQVSGLIRYLETLKVEASNLLTIDFICHGVPSMKCLNAFLSYDGRKVVDMDFRYKDFSGMKIGWHDMAYCEYYESGDNKVFTCNDLHYYYYYYPFLESVMLRKSCYTCNEVNYSAADITVGDFWSINKDKTIADDNKGVSIIKIHTQKALSVWSELKVDGYQREICFDLIQSQLTNKTNGLQKERTFFFAEVEKKGYMFVVRRRYIRNYIRYKIMKYGSRIKRLFIH